MQTENLALISAVGLGVYVLSRRATATNVNVQAAAPVKASPVATSYYGGGTPQTTAPVTAGIKGILGNAYASFFGNVGSLTMPKMTPNNAATDNAAMVYAVMSKDGYAINPAALY